jgi:putative ABC transport system permease protein
VFGNALLLALRAIRRNLMRSTLTTLGIVIGVAAVIVMVTIGAGATAEVTAQIESLGSNLLLVRAGQHMGPGQRVPGKPFTMADAEAVARDLPSVADVAATSDTGRAVIYGNRNWNTMITGADNHYLAVRDRSIALGRPFSDSEVRGGRTVCILGQTVRQELYGAQDPVGEQVRIQGISCRVIGVLAAKGQTAGGTDQDDIVLMPLRAYWRQVAGNRNVEMIQVSARDGYPTARVQSDIEGLFRERRHIGPTEDDDFTVFDLREITQTLTGTTQILTALLGAVAAVSLLVGGIGIMNIMLVSVTERTREIGIRLAVGAREREVLLQFLVEAVVLASFGGLVGIAVALLAAAGLTHLMGLPFVLRGGVVLLAFLFSAAVGVAFGFFPARKAARLDPIEALRYE